VAENPDYLHPMEIEVWRDGEGPIKGFKGGIAMIEFKTQQEILPEDELQRATEEVQTIEVGSAHPTGGWEQTHLN
jgi:hypothetical protein